MIIKFLILFLVQSIEEARKTSQKRGELFVTKVKSCTEKIAKQSNVFITDGAVSLIDHLWLFEINFYLLFLKIILVHSYSDAVLRTLLLAKSFNKRFTVYVTRSMHGNKMADCLKEADIKTILINDLAIGFYMSKFDLILSGAESVCEDGGIINEVYTIIFIYFFKNLI